MYVCMHVRTYACMDGWTEGGREGWLDRHTPTLNPKPLNPKPYWVYFTLQREQS